MKNTKCTVFLALAVAVCGGRAGATEYHWVGGGADNNWSTPENWSPAVKPSATDTVVFDGNSGSGTAIVDAGFHEYVSSLTMTADFKGSVELGRPFKVWHTHTLAGGTFTCGEHSFTNGNANASTAPGNFTQTGGVFNAPTKGELVWRPGGDATRAMPMPGDTSHGVFNLNGARFVVYSSGNCTLVGNGFAFDDFKVTGSTGASLAFQGRTVVNGTFVFDGGRCYHYAYGSFDQTKSCEVLCKGDVVVSGNAVGGTLRLILCGNREQTVNFRETPTSTAYLPRCCGLLSSNEVADVKFVSEDGWARFGYASSVYKVDYGRTFSELYCVTGRLDLSALDVVEVSNYSNAGGARCYGASSVGVIVPPKDVVFRGYKPFLTGRGLVFNGLTFRSWSGTGSGQQPYMTTCATNTVLGTLRFLNGDGTSPERGGVLTSTAWMSPGIAPAQADKRDFSCLNLYGDAVIDHAGSTGTGGTDVMVRFCGDADQTVYCTNSLGFPGVLVDKPEGSKVRFVTDGSRAVIGGTTRMQVGGMLYVDSGTLVVPAEGLMITNCCYGRIFIADKGKIEFEGEGELIAESDQASIMMIKTSQPLERLGLAGKVYLWSLTDKARLRVTKRFALYGTEGVRIPYGSWHYYLDLEGDYYVGPDVTSDNFNINFCGDGDQHYVNDGGMNSGGVNHGVNKFSINKTGGRLILDSDYDLSHRSVGGDLGIDFTSGVLDLNGHVFSAPSGTLTLGADAEIVSTNGGRAVCASVTAVPGATLTYCEPAELPDDTSEFGGIGVPMLTVTNSLSVAAGMRLGVLPTVRSLERRRVKAVGYKSLSGTLDVANWTVAPAAGVKRPKIEHDATAKLVSLTWSYKPDGLLMFVR